MDHYSEELAGPLGDCGVLAGQDDEGHLGGEQGPVAIVLSEFPGCGPPVSSAK